MLSETLPAGALLELLGWREAQLPLDGVRVLDLTRVWAGPLATRQLADLGAEVIRIEHPNSRGPAVVPANSGLRLGIFPEGVWEPDPWNRQGAVNKLNRNKLSVCLNVTGGGGLAVLRGLIAASDVLIENFSARVMPNWGLSWEVLHELNPQLVYLSMPGFGRSGPQREYVANGAIIEPHAGLASLMAYDESQPYRTQATYSDPLVGVVSAWAVIAALLRRQQTSTGELIDLAHTETTTRVIGAEILATQRGAWSPTYGNRDPVFAPQGVYPCRGEDEWLAITVETNEAWRGLCDVLAREDWLTDETLRSSVGRRYRQDELDDAIAGWTSEHDKFEAMRALQTAGVSAGAALTNRDLVESGTLAPSLLVPIVESWGETFLYPGYPVTLHGMERQCWHGAPRLGEHNRLVLHHVLGKSDEEIAGLEATGTLAERPSS